jgi:dTDP-glucose 4,6-dehydratase
MSNDKLITKMPGKKSKPRKVLVTGAEGFIGSHLVEALVRADRDVKAMVLYNFTGSWGWLEQCSPKVKESIELISGDIRDPSSAQDALKDCDVVLNLAALIAIPYSYRAPQSYIETNLLGTLNLLTAARKQGVSRFVQISTSEVYGTAQSVPIREDHPLNAQSPYAASKTGADQLAMSFHHSFGLPVCVLRPFNTYGPRQSARAVIPTVITQLLAGKEKIKLGSLHPTRDFCFVRDTARGMIAAADAPGCEGEVIQLGTGFEISIGDVAHLIAEVMGRKLEIDRERERVRPKGSEVERLLADPAKAKRLLKWSPKWSGAEGLKRGLAETIDWFSKKENLARYKADLHQL